MKFSVFTFLLIILVSCAPHKHVLKPADPTAINTEMINIDCLKTSKYLLATTQKADSLCFSSRSLKKTYCDTLNNTNAFLYYKYRISDLKFHRSLKNDTIKIKMLIDHKWIEKLYVAELDSYLE